MNGGLKVGLGAGQLVHLLTDSSAAQAAGVSQHNVTGPSTTERTHGAPISHATKGSFAHGSSAVAHCGLSPQLCVASGLHDSPPPLYSVWHTM
mgnify:CR=1 FL=1